MRPLVLVEVLHGAGEQAELVALGNVTIVTLQAVQL